MDDLKTLLFNLELMKDLPSKRKLLEEIAHSRIVSQKNKQPYIWRPQDLNSCQYLPGEPLA